MINFLKKISALNSLYKISLAVLIVAFSFGAVSLASASTSSKHSNVSTPFKTNHVNSKAVTTAPANNVSSAPSVNSDNAPTSSSQGNVQSKANSTSAATTKTVTTNTSSAAAAVVPVKTTPPASSVGGVYDGYGYHVENTQIVDTISRASAQVCAGYLCGKNGPIISYNSSSPPAGSFQFVEGNDIADNVVFSIKSGGLSKGNSPAFSPISISPNLPNGTYRGSIQLQFDIDTNDDYANGPAIAYTVYLTD